jgi:single-strand DNA-binding protein
MASGVNRVCLIGHVVRAFEVKYTPGNNTAVCEFSIALNSREKVDGEWQDYASFVDVTVWGEQAEACAQYLGKGSQVGVDGKLRQDRWQTQDGGKRSKIKVVADNVQFLKSHGRDEQEASGTTADFGGDFGQVPF